MRENMESQGKNNLEDSERENNRVVFNDKTREAMRRILESTRRNRPEDDNVNDDFYREIDKYLDGSNKQ